MQVTRIIMQRLCILAVILLPSSVVLFRLCAYMVCTYKNMPYMYSNLRTSSGGSTPLGVDPCQGTEYVLTPISCNSFSIFFRNHTNGHGVRLSGPQPIDLVKACQPNKRGAQVGLNRQFCSSLPTSPMGPVLEGFHFLQ